MAGGVAVPIYPPSSPTGLEEHLNRQAVLLGNASPAVLVTVPEASLVARLLRARVPSLRSVTSEAALRAGAEGDGPALPTAAATDMALLQYTSGSTGDPKGVMLTHRHLLANIRAMGEAACAGPADVFVSWLPLYHDMGLIGAWLAGLCFGFPLVVMSPLAFMSRPARWLRAISDYHGTLSAAPNFGYELCARQVPEPGAGRRGPVVMAAGLRRLGDGQPRHDTPVQPAVSSLRAAAARCWRQPTGWPKPAWGHLPAARPRAGHRRHRSRRTRPDGARGASEPRAPCPAGGRILRAAAARLPAAGGGFRRPEAGERCEGRVEFTGPSATPGYYRNEAATGRCGTARGP